MDTTSPKHALNTAALKTFYNAITQHNMSPLWEVLHALVPPAPNTPCQPAHWKYSDVRPYLMQSGQLISAEEAVPKQFRSQLGGTREPVTPSCQQYLSKQYQETEIWSHRLNGLKLLPLIR